MNIYSVNVVYRKYSIEKDNNWNRESISGQQQPNCEKCLTAGYEYHEPTSGK